MATLDISKTALANLFRREGQDEGRVDEAREAVLAVGQKRFGPPPAEVTAAIQAVADLARLHELRDRLLDVAGWRDLLAGHS